MIQMFLLCNKIIDILTDWDGGYISNGRKIGLFWESRSTTWVVRVPQLGRRVQQTFKEKKKKKKSQLGSSAKPNQNYSFVGLSWDPQEPVKTQVWLSMRNYSKSSHLLETRSDICSLLESKNRFRNGIFVAFIQTSRKKLLCIQLF